MTNLREALCLAAAKFPLAPARAARRQGAKLLRAKAYLNAKGIAAADPHSKLVYTKAMSMFNPGGGRA